MRDTTWDGGWAKNMDKRRSLSADLQQLRSKQSVSKTCVSKDPNSSANLYGRYDFSLDDYLYSIPLFLSDYPLLKQNSTSNVSHLRSKQSVSKTEAACYFPDLYPSGFTTTFSRMPPLNLLYNSFSFSPSLLCTGSTHISLTGLRLTPETSGRSAWRKLNG